MAGKANPEPKNGNGNGKAKGDYGTPSPGFLPAKLDSLPPSLEDIPDRFEACLRLIEHGSSIAEAARLQSVPIASIYYWSERGTQVEARAERFAAARKHLAHAAMAKIGEVAAQLVNPLEHVTDPRWVAGWSSSLDKGARLWLEVAKRLNPSEYGDKLETRNTTINIAYAVDFGATRSSAKQAQLIDIEPAGDLKSLDNQGNKRVRKPKK